MGVHLHSLLENLFFLIFVTVVAVPQKVSLVLHRDVDDAQSAQQILMFLLSGIELLVRQLTLIVFQVFKFYLHIFDLLQQFFEVFV